jgi:hypothetical protein
MIPPVPDSSASQFFDWDCLTAITKRTSNGAFTVPARSAVVLIEK